MPELPAGTVTFLFTDIEGSTALLKQLGRTRYAELLARQQVLLREAFAANGGEEIDMQGDSFFVAFRSASDAVATAVAIERSLADHEWPDGGQVRVRIGIHTGEAAAAGERYVGFSVHRAARIGSAAHGSQVLLSDATRVLVEDDLPKGVFLGDLGEWQLKDIDRPARIWQVAAEGLPREFPPLRGAEPVKTKPVLRRKSALAAALLGVIAAAVAIPVFALGGSGGSTALGSVGANAVGAIDPATGRIVASVPVDASPGQVATGAGAVWSSNSPTGTVSRIDPAKNAVVDKIPVGGDPSGIAVGDGSVWVANALGGDVFRISPATDTRTDTILVGNGPRGVAFGSGAVWVALLLDRKVARIDPTSGKVVERIPVGAGPSAITVGAGSVWTANTAEDSVSRIDARTNQLLTTIPVGNGPDAIAFGDGAVWVANSLDNTIARIDPTTNSTTNKVPVGTRPSGIVVTPSTVLVGSQFAETVVRIDPRTSKQIGKATQLGNQPQGFAPAPAAGSVWVGVAASGATHRGGTLRIVASNDPIPSLDPATSYAWPILNATDDGLTAVRRVGGAPGTTVVPDLATALPNPTDNGRTYVFQLGGGTSASRPEPSCAPKTCVARSNEASN
jgi:YVTN family beta-propeller protein